MSKEIKGYVFKLKPTTKQQNRINQTFGCVRKVKNELLNDIKTGRQRSIPEIKKEYPYTYDNDSQAYTSMCKHKQNMPTEIRVYKCKECGQELNRDQNAALNLTIKHLVKEFQLETGISKYKWISV